MLDFLGMSSDAIIFVACVAFAAGVVRGFTGFALSAVTMAGAALVLPPVSLIPVLWWMELAASAVMLKGGWANANRKVAYGLVIGSAVGLPIGLALTIMMAPDTSRFVALVVVAILAASQLRKLDLKFLATTPGLYGSGVLAGIVTGLAGVGAMVVALYVLALKAPAAQMRGSLVLYLALASVVSGAVHVLFGTMDMTALWRGLFFSVPTVGGVLLGSMLFVPKWEPYYKPVCLWLLIGLAALGVMRLIAGF